MKTTAEIKEMLFERLAELQAGGLTERYEEQCKIELALLYDILGDEIEEEHCAIIENAM